LGHLTVKSEIYYDPDYANTIIEDDVEIVNDYLAYPDEEDVDKVSSWVLRFELDKNALIDRNITSREIKNKIMEFLPDKVQVIYDDRVMPEKPIIRLRLKDIQIPNDE
jgi:DNA-directed RNA polymerase II subunit RPB1